MPDISPILQFVFYEPVYYRAYEPGFPSENRELSGQFVGIAENVGHTLTYKILSEKNENIIFCSVVRSAIDTIFHNRKGSNDQNSNLQPFLRSQIDDTMEEEGGYFDSPADIEG